MTPLPPPHMRRPDVQSHDLLAVSCCPEVHSFDRATASADRTGCPRPARGRGKGSAMKPFRVWGTRAAALALLLVMATNALATPSRPIDDDPSAPPIPTVYLGDPSDSGGGYAQPAPAEFSAILWEAFRSVLNINLNAGVYLSPLKQSARTLNSRHGVRPR